MSSNSTKEKKDKFIELYPKNACNISKTCKEVNIDRQTYYNWIDADKEFNKRCKDEEEGLIDFTESMLMKNISDGKEISILFYLKTKGKGRGYIEQQDHYLSGEVKHTYQDVKNILGEAVQDVPALPESIIK